MRKYLLLFILPIVACLISAPFLATGQTNPDTIARKIDNLFNNYQTRAAPGAVVAVLNGDSVLYLKGYGMANLEYAIPNEPKTVYYICSLAKQFTAYAVLLLAKEHKLALDDDIRTWLPWMHDFGKKITIRNLLHHTSGIRDDLGLLKIAGIGSDGIISQQLALNLLKRQQTLNFLPGEQMSYSNSNYILLAEIVKAASGQSFRRFSDSAIFEPLHMTHSHFYENPGDIIPGRAVSYTAAGPGHYQNSQQNVYTLGDGGLFMPMNDMICWVQNFFHNRIGSATDIELLNEKAKLNNGKEVSNTSMAIKGWDAYAYNGGLNGYKTFATIFPDQKTAFIVFANNGDDNTYNLMYPLADLFIRGKQTVFPPEQPAPAFKDSTVMRKYAGEFLADNNLYFRFYTDSGKLYLKQGGPEPLIQKTRDTFIYPGNHQISFVFSTIRNKGAVNLTFTTPDQCLHMNRYELNKKYTDAELSAYTGAYYSKELDCRYEIVLRDHQLRLSGHQSPDSPIHLWDTDNLKNDELLGHFNILRNSAHAITGFEINNGNLSHLYFNKIR
jgi:CubicO group peptidase (beta-lactamase class C family)